jgi:hypothetical protein
VGRRSTQLRHHSKLTRARCRRKSLDFRR